MDTEELEASRAAKRERDFKSKRAAHYNEFLRAKELMAKGALDDDERDDEEGGAGRGKGEAGSGKDGEGAGSATSCQPRPHGALGRVQGMM